MALLTCLLAGQRQGVVVSYIHIWKCSKQREFKTKKEMEILALHQNTECMKSFILPTIFVHSTMSVPIRRAKSKFVVSTVVLTAIFYVFQACNSGLVFAQTNEDILISLGNSSYAPMTNVDANQVKVTIKYQVNDESLENEKVNGIMKVYSSNGTLVHSSSFPDGFVAEKKGGSEDFKTTIRDPELKDVIANVTFVDLGKESTLSNTVTTNLHLQESSTSSITATAGDEDENDSSSDISGDTSTIEDENENENEEEE
jgi:hypothetical protein